MHMKKGFSFNDVSIIGRRKHGLGEQWECFSIDASQYPTIKYSMGVKDENGHWEEAAMHDTFNAEEATVYSAMG